jgi:hypothetical protein
MRTYKMIVEATNAPLSMYFIKYIDVKATCPNSAAEFLLTQYPNCTISLCSIM